MKNRTDLNKYPISYLYCRICGREPRTYLEEPNRTGILFWDPDDGWIVGTLCRWCFDEIGNAKPKPEDYAYNKYYDMPEVDTDEDIGPYL